MANSRLAESAGARTSLVPLWLVATTATLVVGAFGLYRTYRSPPPATRDMWDQLVHDLGLSVDFMTTISFVVPLVLAAILAGIVFVARRDEPFALLFSYSLVGLFVYITGAPRQTAAAVPELEWLATAVEVAAGISCLFALFLFPNGRFLPRWGRPVAWLFALALMGMPWIPAVARLNPEADPWRRTVAGAVMVSILVSAALAQTVRYRRHSNAIERQQMKWVLFGFGVVLAPALGVQVATLIGAPLLEGWLLLIMSFLTPVLPLTAAVATLRLRLFDLERVVSLTVTWATLTVLLAALYFGLVIGLRSLLQPVTGDSDLAVGISTLAVAALFSPVRRRIQHVVNHRFYRRHRDHHRLLDEFSHRLDDQVDLESLTADLGDVITQTLQPAAVGVWIKPFSRDKPPV